MNITSQGVLTGPSAMKFVRYLAKNETVLAKAAAKARENLPEFMDLAFDIPPETRRAFRQIMTPEFSGLLVDFVLQAIRSGNELEITAEPAKPGPDGEVALAIQMEVTTTPGPSAGPHQGATKYKVRCKPDDGTGHPIPN